MVHLGSTLSVKITARLTTRWPNSHNICERTAGIAARVVGRIVEFRVDSDYCWACAEGGVCISREAPAEPQQTFFSHKEVKPENQLG